MKLRGACWSDDLSTLNLKAPGWQPGIGLPERLVGFDRARSRQPGAHVKATRLELLHCKELAVAGRYAILAGYYREFSHAGKYGDFEILVTISAGKVGWVPVCTFVGLRAAFNSLDSADLPREFLAVWRLLGGISCQGQYSLADAGVEDRQHTA